ncbi:hypothetical protein [Shewanella atlantica]|uniref:hypothetical protein n=1 Tax=Shewanella atlantica TaxID=271099 RepID=UPI0037368A34
MKVGLSWLPIASGGACADTFVARCKYVRVSSTAASLPPTATAASTPVVSGK